MPGAAACFAAPAAFVDDGVRPPPAATVAGAIGLRDGAADFADATRFEPAATAATAAAAAAPGFAVTFAFAAGLEGIPGLAGSTRTAEALGGVAAFAGADGFAGDFACDTGFAPAGATAFPDAGDFTFETGPALAVVFALGATLAVVFAFGVMLGFAADGADADDGTFTDGSGPFAFTGLIDWGTLVDVTVAQQPAAAFCWVDGGTFEMKQARSVFVTCN